ncbi:hypothetical protein DL769_002769 [Monosporascus sp. CRB-8-3]|nr:hypothetical protein DL769_002769 [Monosporascus sp. CRB-8-3]
MSRYFPHTAYAEDQPLAKTILTTHVLARSVTTGTAIGGVLFTSRLLYQSVTKKPAAPSPSLSTRQSGARAFLRTAGTSTLWTLGIVSAGLVGRMWGREDIEWRDRAWRLLENRGQLETDDWTCAGMVAGLAASAAARGPPLGWVGVLGSVGTGSFLGMLGYMGWRYGVHRGRFPDVKKEDGE